MIEAQNDIAFGPVWTKNYPAFENYFQVEFFWLNLPNTGHNCLLRPISTSCTSSLPMSSLDYDVGSKGVVHEPQSEQKEFALRPVDHMKYIQNLSAKPLRVIVNDFHMSKHGHAIVRRPESVERSHGVRALDAFLIHNITEEVIYDTNNTMHKAHRVFVASGSGGAYCDVGWMVWEEVHNCMRCGIAICDTVSKDKHHCTSCGDIVCTPCGAHFAAVEELQSPEKFRVCSKCYKSEV